LLISLLKHFWNLSYKFHYFCTFLIVSQVCWGSETCNYFFSPRCSIYCLIHHSTNIYQPGMGVHTPNISGGRKTEFRGQLGQKCETSPEKQTKSKRLRSGSIWQNAFLANMRPWMQSSVLSKYKAKWNPNIYWANYIPIQVLNIGDLRI
jgi:hypothetical protein